MELIYTNLNNINIPKGIVGCVGVFDGVHNGHNSVIGTVKEIGKSCNLKTALITFDPHPDYVLGKTCDEYYITPLEDRINTIKKLYNLDYMIIIEFTEKLSKLSYVEFYNLFLSNLKVIVVGEGFRFGYKNLGTVNELIGLHSKNDNKVIAVSHYLYNNQDKKVSSQDAVLLLKEGKIEDVVKLGIKYKVSGIVTKGSQIGNKIGYPTANVQISDKYCPIKNGVYAVVIIIDEKRFLGIANYGYNPSFNKIEKPRLEVHIFEFNENIYDKKVEVEFISFIREEKKFKSIDDFLKQLEIDCNKCINKCGGKYETINCRGNG